MSSNMNAEANNPSAAAKAAPSSAAASDTTSLGRDGGTMASTVSSHEPEQRQEQQQLKPPSYKDPRRELHPSTAVITAGYRSDLSESAIKPPVFRSSTFEFHTAAAGELFFQRAYHLPGGDDGQKPGLIYSRLNNPNTEILEDKMVALETQSCFALAFPSGMSAISTSILALIPAGGHVLYSNPVYGGTYFFLKSMCPERFGITTQAVDSSRIDQVEAAIQNASSPIDAIFLESPANPTLRLTDIAAISALVKQRNPNCLVMVDNTLMGPVFQHPFLHGADVVVYSATKFLSGHSDLIAGVVLTQREDYISRIQGYRTILGPVISPDTSWMLTRSLETVWLRMQRQAEKAQHVAAALRQHPRVAQVLFPGGSTKRSGNSTTDTREDDEQQQLALFERQCIGTGSMITIVVRPDTRQAAYTVLDNLRLAHLAVSLGSTESLVQHPRSMTHSDMSIEDLDACGISEGMIRISVGLEASTDIIKDFVHALDQIKDESNYAVAVGQQQRRTTSGGTCGSKKNHILGMSQLALFCFCFLLCLVGGARAVDSNFLVGTGIYDITGPAAQVNMMGYAKPEQTTAGIHQRLWARAFLFGKQDQNSAVPMLQHPSSWWMWRSRLRAPISPKYTLDPLQTVCFVSIDSGMGSDLLNTRVLDRLDELLPGQSPCTIENLSISGTHTHSAPGGFIQYVLYQLTGTGFVEETMHALVEGTAQAIVRAFRNIQPGHLRLSEGMLWDANINRSPSSYLLNPTEERELYSEHGDTDKTMLQIFVQGEQSQPLGLLNWFAVHGTSMNGTNQLISGDNKGYASYLMEKHYNGNETTPGTGSFVAAFASTNLGDVSPNTAGPRCLDTGLPCDMLTSTCNGHMPLCVAFGPGEDMFESTEIIGRKQFEKSLDLSQSKHAVLRGRIRSRHSFIDLSHRNVTLPNGTITHTCPAALGLSFAGGTMDGSGGLDFHQGMNTSHPFWAMVFGHLSLPSKEQIACQAPKPIMLNTGKVKLPYDWDPNTVPISIFQVGNLFILNVPGELTTMAGRRLRKAVKEELENAGIDDASITIAGLANSYTHYVVTYEEYQAQRYEAASTLYGPYTLDAYLQEFRRIVQDLLTDTPSASDDAPKDMSRRQVSLLSPVELDVVAPGYSFGEVVTDTQDSYTNNGTETARVVFRSANPRNNQRIQGTFLTVDQLSEHGIWKTIYTDGDWATRYYWKGGTSTSFGMSYAEIHWNIAEGIPQGLYRICHFGSRLTLWGDAKAWAYYSPEWLNPFGSIGVHIVNQSIRFALALSQTFRSLLGMEGNYRLKEFEGCSSTFLVHDA